MSDSAPKKDFTGKPFERLVAAVQRKLDQGAVVEWNHRLVGACGVTRQVDVAIHGHVNSTRVFIAIEARDYNKKLDIDQVEAFIAKLDDIGAQKGILVTTIGYERGALLRARTGGIVTCVLRPANDDDWKGRVQYIEMRVFARSVRCEDAILVLMDDERVPVPMNGYLPVVYDDGEETTVRDMVWKILESQRELEGEFNQIHITSPRHYLRDDPRRRQIKGLAGTFRCVDELGIHSVTKAPHDWVFVQHLPDGAVEEEKSFFIFRDLEKLANEFKVKKSSP